jgi:hypothetical protein
MKRGNLKYEKFVQWMDRLYKTTDREVDCDQTRQLLASYVDGKVAGSVPDPEYLPLLRHLDQCPDCSELYEGLYRVVELEAWGELPSAAILLEEIAVKTDLNNGEIYT